jgi:hypothetical protein
MAATKAAAHEPLVCTRQVSDYTGFAEQTLINWRCQGKGPASTRSAPGSGTAYPTSTPGSKRRRPR